MHLTRRRIQGEVAERHDGALDGLFGPGTAQQRPQSRKQFLQRERLGQVVISPGVQARHPLGYRVAGGQNQDRQVIPGAAQLAAHLQPVQPRHHHIEHHRVGPLTGDCLEGLHTVLSEIDGVTVERQGPPEGLPHCTVVVDHKYSHGA